MNRKIYNRKEKRNATEEEIKMLVETDLLRILVFHPDYMTLLTTEKSENEKLREAIDWLLGQICDIVADGNEFYFEKAEEILAPLGFDVENDYFGG